MRRNLLILSAVTALVFLFFLPPRVRAEEGNDLWRTDFDKAVAEAKQTGKDLLVDFSGSDWCIWCKRLDGEVFSKKEFKEAAPKKFILVVLDFPRNKKVANRKRNQELFDQFHLTGYPTVLLMDKNGVAYAKTGYRPGGPKAYLEHLDALKNAPEPKRIHRLMEGIRKAKDDKEKLAKVKTALDYFDTLRKDGDKFESFGIGFLDLVEPAKQALALDPENAQGIKAKAAVFLLENGDQSPETRKAIESLDPKNAQGYLEKLLMADLQPLMRERKYEEVVKRVESFLADKKFHEKDTGVYARYMAAFAAFNGLKDKEKAKRLCKEALALKPDNARLASAIERFMKSMDS